MPQAGDDILFEFNNAVELHGYRLRSGNYEHPSDLLYNTSVEIRPTDLGRVKGSYKISDKDFISVGTENEIPFNVDSTKDFSFYAFLFHSLR